VDTVGWLEGGKSDRLVFQASLKSWTSLRVGGPADAMVFPESTEEIREVVHFCQEVGIPFMILGLGSNTIFPDEGFRGMVISTRERFQGFHFRDNEVKALCGVKLPVLAREAASRGLSGLEFGVGIPGTVGGAIWMNAGTRNRHVGGLINSVSVLRHDVTIRIYRQEELVFGYRNSPFMKTDEIILEADFFLQEVSPERAREGIHKELEQRRRTQPVQERSVGCIFKNPSGRSAGDLIDRAGCKGWEVGGAQVSRIHANFVVTREGTRASDVMELIHRVRFRVHSRFETTLDLEVVVLDQHGKRKNL